MNVVGMGAVRKIVMRLLVAACCLPGSAALADKRVALVIGNSGYEKVARLGNPANDAALMADTFKRAGFDDVDLRRDLKIADLRRALRDFVDKASDADVAVVYYAGHGIELDGVNYLIPVDAILDRDRDIYDEALSLERVLVAVEPAKKLRLVILDACRDSPFTRSMKRTLAARAIGRGLAKVEPTSPNTLIAFASKAGSTASDGDGKNSPFTAALVKHVTTPGVDLRKAFGYVRDEVLKSTGNKQEPYLYGSLGGDDLSLVPAKSMAAGPQADPQAAVRRDYELALQLGTRDGWEAFLSQYPEGFYANLAKGQLKKIGAEEARAAAAAKAHMAEQEKARLAVEGAKQAETAKLGAAAKAAEEARIAAEKVKQVEQEKADAAEKTRLAEQDKVRIAAEKTKSLETEKAAAVEQARVTSEKAESENKQQLAALPPTREMAEQPAGDLSRALQTELRRVGCSTTTVDGNWSAASQKALDRFNKYTGNLFDTRVASADALDAAKEKTSRVCPLLCDTGYRADGDRCVKITCRAGTQLNDDGTCSRAEKKANSKTLKRSAEIERTTSPKGFSSHRMLPGEPPDGTIPTGARVTVQSSACPRGQVLELIGGSIQHNIRRQKRCIAAN
jgi:uncharacterized caspase-like protein